MCPPLGIPFATQSIDKSLKLFLIFFLEPEVIFVTESEQSHTPVCKQQC